MKARFSRSSSGQAAQRFQDVARDVQAGLLDLGEICEEWDLSDFAQDD